MMTTLDSSPPPPPPAPPAPSSPAQHVAIVGAGPGGYVAAIRLAQLGHTVTLIHKDALGGTCLHWGCIPSKALIQASHHVHTLRHGHLGSLGISTSGAVTLDMPRLQQWKQGLINSLANGVAGLLKRPGITVVQGTAHFANEKTLAITPAQGDAVQTLTPDAIILATGAQAVAPASVPVDGQWSLFAQQLLELDAVPDTLGIVGAGIIGLELGMMMSALGAKVWIVDSADTLLPGWDRDVVQVLAKSLKALGVEVMLNTHVQAVDVGQHTVTVRSADAAAQDQTLTCDKLLVAVGRAPATQALHLTAGQVALTGTGGRIAVDSQCRSLTNPKVFAIGDLIDGPQLAHKASKEAQIVAAVIDGQPQCRDWRALPLVVFTQPEMASVGLTENQATAQGRAVKVGKFPFAANAMAMALNPATPHGGGFVKWLADPATDRLLGASTIGPHAATLIAEAALALELGATAEDLALTIHGHPTVSEPWQEAAEALHHQAIHLYKGA
jgi:dihydrolipoamide dehydrogenase